LGDLNDPMEGRYLYESFGGEKEDVDNVLEDKKQGIRAKYVTKTQSDFEEAVGIRRTPSVAAPAWSECSAAGPVRSERGSALCARVF
jgi:hypothetical protein